MRALPLNGWGTLGMLSSDEKAAHYRQQAAALRDMAGLSRSDAKLKEQLIEAASDPDHPGNRLLQLGALRFKNVNDSDDKGLRNPQE